MHGICSCMFISEITFIAEKTGVTCSRFHIRFTPEPDQRLNYVSTVLLSILSCCLPPPICKDHQDWEKTDCQLLWWKLLHFISCSSLFPFLAGQQDRRNDLSHPIHADNCLLDPEANECWKEPPAYTFRDYRYS